MALSALRKSAMKGVFATEQGPPIRNAKRASQHAFGKGVRAQFRGSKILHIKITRTAGREK